MFAFLARIFLILIAISALKYAIEFVQRLWLGTGASRTVSRRSQQQPATTVLQQDPVCGTYVAIDSSLKRVVNGRVVHFCSPECRDRFAA